MNRSNLKFHIGICLLLFIVLTSFGCKKKAQGTIIQDDTLKTTLIEAPENSSPSQTEDLKNVYIAAYVFEHQPYVTGTLKGAAKAKVVGISYTQNVNGIRIITPIGMFTQNISSSTLKKTAEQKYFYSNTVALRGASKISSTKANWDNSVRVVSNETYDTMYGSYPNELSSYIFSERTIISYKVLKNTSDEFTIQLELDPELAPNDYKKDVKTNGGASSYPVFHSCSMTISMNSKWEIQEMESEEVYTMNLPGLGNFTTSTITTETFNYGVNTIEDAEFFEKYRTEEENPDTPKQEETKDATYYLQTLLGDFTSSPTVHFAIDAPILKEKGDLVLKIKDLSDIEAYLSISQIQLSLKEEILYIQSPFGAFQYDISTYLDPLLKMGENEEPEVEEPEDGNEHNILDDFVLRKEGNNVILTLPLTLQDKTFSFILILEENEDASSTKLLSVIVYEGNSVLLKCDRSSKEMNIPSIDYTNTSNIEDGKWILDLVKCFLEDSFHLEGSLVIKENIYTYQIDVNLDSIAIQLDIKEQNVLLLYDRNEKMFYLNINDEYCYSISLENILSSIEDYTVIDTDVSSIIDVIYKNVGAITLSENNIHIDAFSYFISFRKTEENSYECSIDGLGSISFTTSNIEVKPLDIDKSLYTEIVSVGVFKSILNIIEKKEATVEGSFVSNEVVISYMGQFTPNEFRLDVTFEYLNHVLPLCIYYDGTYFYVDYSEFHIKLTLDEIMDFAKEFIQYLNTSWDLESTDSSFLLSNIQFEENKIDISCLFKLANQELPIQIQINSTENCLEIKETNTNINFTITPSIGEIQYEYKTDYISAEDFNHSIDYLYAVTNLIQSNEFQLNGEFYVDKENYRAYTAATKAYVKWNKETVVSAYIKLVLFGEAKAYFEVLVTESTIYIQYSSEFELNTNSYIDTTTNNGIRYSILRSDIQDIIPLIPEVLKDFLDVDLSSGMNQKSVLKQLLDFLFSSNAENIVTNFHINASQIQMSLNLEKVVDILLEQQDSYITGFQVAHIPLKDQELSFVQTVSYDTIDFDQIQISDCIPLNNISTLAHGIYENVSKKKMEFTGSVSMLGIDIQLILQLDLENQKYYAKLEIPYMMGVTNSKCDSYLLIENNEIYMKRDIYKLNFFTWKYSYTDDRTITFEEFSNSTIDQICYIMNLTSMVKSLCKQNGSSSESKFAFDKLFTNYNSSDEMHYDLSFDLSQFSSSISNLSISVELEGYQDAYALKKLSGSLTVVNYLSLKYNLTTSIDKEISFLGQ